MGPVTYERRPYLPAVVGPRASRTIVAEVGEQLAALATQLQSSRHDANRDAGREVEAALASMKESARQSVERVATPAGGCAGATTQPVRGRVGSSSESPVVEPRPTMTVREVAARFRVSTAYVRRLCENEVLAATKPGREWLIDAGSVSTFETVRRPMS